MMMGLQRSVGNARVSSLLSKKTSKAVTSQLFRPQIKKNVKEKEREEGPKSVDEQAGEIGVPEPEQPPKVSLTSLLAEPKKAPSEPASGTANSDSTSHEETGNNISPLLTGQVSRLIASPLTIARVQDEKPANSSSDAEVTSGNTEARKADPGKIKDLKARLTSARRASHRRIESQTPLIKADLTKNADQLHQSVDSQVATAVTSLKIAFDAERKELQATVRTARGQLTLPLHFPLLDHDCLLGLRVRPPRGPSINTTRERAGNRQRSAKRRWLRAPGAAAAAPWPTVPGCSECSPTRWTSP